MTQELTFTVIAEIDNTKGIEFNADQIADRIIGWNCSMECEGGHDVEHVTVTHAESGVSVEWSVVGGKQETS